MLYHTNNILWHGEICQQSQFFLTVGLQSSQSRKKSSGKVVFFLPCVSSGLDSSEYKLEITFTHFDGSYPQMQKSGPYPPPPNCSHVKLYRQLLDKHFCACSPQHSNPLSSVWLLTHLPTFIICWIWKRNWRLSLEMLETRQSYGALQKRSPLCRIFHSPRNSNKLRSNCELINFSSRKLRKKRSLCERQSMESAETSSRRLAPEFS